MVLRGRRRGLGGMECWWGEAGGREGGAEETCRQGLRGAAGGRGRRKAALTRPWGAEKPRAPSLPCAWLPV